MKHKTRIETESGVSIGHSEANDIASVGSSSMLIRARGQVMKKRKDKTTRGLGRGSKKIDNASIEGGKNKKVLCYKNEGTYGGRIKRTLDQTSIALSRQESPKIKQWINCLPSRAWVHSQHNAGVMVLLPLGSEEGCTSGILEDLSNTLP